MKNERLENEIKNIIADILEVDIKKLSMKTRIKDVSSWDSIHQVIITSSLEEKYNIIFPDDILFELSSIEAIVREVSQLI
jgi:acyl carrier protein